MAHAYTHFSARCVHQCTSIQLLPRCAPTLSSQVLAWLRAKVEQAKRALLASPSSSSYASMEGVALTAYAAGMLSEYLGGSWPTRLAQVREKEIVCSSWPRRVRAGHGSSSVETDPSCYTTATGHWSPFWLAGPGPARGHAGGRTSAPPATDGGRGHAAGREAPQGANGVCRGGEGRRLAQHATQQQPVG